MCAPVVPVSDASSARDRRLRVLLTNTALETRGGSELYLLEVACWLRDHGHLPVLYSARLGPLADAIRKQALPVIDDLSRLAEPPDLIHAQHHLPAMAALARFPSTPTVYFCHGWLPWDEAPLRHPAIRRYVAVSQATRERLVAEHAVPPGVVHLLPNFVDTRRFQPRDALPARPQRALVFSNQAVEGGWVEMLRQACGARGIEVDVSGWQSGRPLDRPEEALGAYDLVFARGRSALEAMAVGCAVVLCDAEGLGPMVAPDNLERLGLGNFGMQVLRDAHRPELFLRAIDAYDVEGAGRVSALVRERRALDVVVPQVFAVYEEALADHDRAPHDVVDAHAAAGEYVTWLHREFPVPWLTGREAYARTLVDVEARGRDLAAEVEHLRGQLHAQAHAHQAALDAERAALRASHEAALVAAAVEAERAATARVDSAIAEAERTATGRVNSAVADAERAAMDRMRTEVAEAERQAAGRAESEAEALRSAHQAALDAAAAEAGRLRDELARVSGDADALRVTLARIHAGFLYRWLLTPLWKARLRLMPDGSGRYRAYRAVRSAIGRQLHASGRPGPATARHDVAAPAPPHATAPPAQVPARTRLLCVTPFRNERHYLADFFANVAPHVDGIIALDDGSSDGSGLIAAAHPAVLEVMRIPPREPHQWDELRNRRLLVEAASRHGAEWVLALDADERLERDFRNRMEAVIACAGPDGPMAYDIVIRELWDAPNQYRVDGVWGRKRSARLFRLRPDHDFGSRALHGHWAPENSRGPDGAFVLADLVVYHLRMIDAADRERRMRRYMALDPDRQWQAIGYEYLCDSTGLQLESLPAGRDYLPLGRRSGTPASSRVEPAAVTATTGHAGETVEIVSPGAAMAVVVMDVGGEPVTVEAVGSLLAQDPTPEVVVVSSGGGDIDRQLANAGMDVMVLQSARRLLPGAARNVGIAATHAPCVGFLAGDCLARPGWVAGRLAAHASGADAVSSAVVNHTPWNPFAAAAHYLLFAARLPGSPPGARLDYGASYARELFTRFGVFRSDLRTGEDTELRERFGGQVPIVFRGDVQAAHRNPTSLPGLLRDQFQRGRRTVRAREALYPGPARAVVTRSALTRWPGSVRASLAATPAKEWGRILWGLPWVMPAALAYAAGAATTPPTPHGAAADRASLDRAAAAPASPPAGGPRRWVRMLCLITFRNERRHLADYLANVAPQFDGIVALDDGSTDGSGDIVAAHPSVLEVLRIAPREPHRWNGVTHRRLLVDAAARHGAEWVLALDADERVERGFRDRAERLIVEAGPEGPMAYAVTLRELWDRPNQYRVDGLWGRKAIARFFRMRRDHDFGAGALHGHWAPENSRGPDGAFVRADLTVYHLKMIRAEDRERRMRRYQALDPGKRWQRIGYDYLVDTTGLQLEPLPPGREYDPLPAHVDDAPAPRPQKVDLAGHVAVVEI